MKYSPIVVFLFMMFGCTDSEYYKVRFDDVAYLVKGDKVMLNDQEVGEVKNLVMDDEWKIVATIWVGRGIKLPKGSTFTIRSGWGGRTVEIDRAGNAELMDPNEIQIGRLQRDSTKALNIAEFDSLLMHDPNFKFLDTILKVVVPTMREKIREQGQNP
ncbi:MAG: MlaD family protein [Chryseolinea sp.]